MKKTVIIVLIKFTKTFVIKLEILLTFTNINKKISKLFFSKSLKKLRLNFFFV
jgi:hypothetical protein